MKKPIGIDSSLLLTRRGICNAQKTSCLREMTVKVPVVNYMKIPVVNFMKIVMSKCRDIFNPFEHIQACGSNI